MNIQKLSFIAFLASCIAAPSQALQQQDELVSQQEIHEKKNNFKSFIKNNKKASALFATIAVIACGCFVASKRNAKKSMRETELPTINDRSRIRHKPQELHTFKVNDNTPPTLFPRDEEDSREFNQLILSQSSSISIEEIKGESDNDSLSEPKQMVDGLKSVTPTVKAQPKVAARIQLFEALSTNNAQDSSNKKVQKPGSDASENTHLSLEEESSYFTIPQQLNEYTGQISKRVSSIYKSLSFRIYRNEKPQKTLPSEVTWTP